METNLENFVVSTSIFDETAIFVQPKATDRPMRTFQFQIDLGLLLGHVLELVCVHLSHEWWELVRLESYQGHRSCDHVFVGEREYFYSTRENMPLADARNVYKATKGSNKTRFTTGSFHFSEIRFECKEEHSKCAVESLSGCNCRYTTESNSKFCATT